MVTALLLVIIALLLGGGIWLFSKLNTLQSPRVAGKSTPQSVETIESEVAKVDCLPVVYVENVLANVSFQDFVAGVLDPDEVSPAMQNLWEADVKRLFDVVATGWQAWESSTRFTVELTEKGTAAMKAGGKFMELKQSGEVVSVVLDSKGKIVEFGRVVGPGVVKYGTSLYTFAVGCAWQLVARDLKNEMQSIGKKLADLLELHETHEAAQLEAAYESIRFIKGSDVAADRNEIFNAILIAKQVRSRARQRLGNHSGRIASPKWHERFLSFRSWMTKDLEKVDREFSHLANIQISLMLEAHAVRLLGDTTRERNFAIILGEESLRLNQISADFRETWEQEPKRKKMGDPILLPSIERMSQSLSLIAAKSGEIEIGNK